MLFRSVKYKIAKEFESFKPLILGIKSFFKDSKVSIHKARNEIKILKFNDSQVVAKSFKKPNFFNRIVYSFFRDSKAKKSYMYARKIAHFTPCAIGYIEFFENKLLGESYFVSEKFEYDFTIREPLLEPNFDSRKQIFKEFALDRKSVV